MRIDSIDRSQIIKDKWLNIQQNGVIHGGKIHWYYDPLTEKMSWWGYVVIKILWFRKKFDFDWCHKLGRSIMTSNNYHVGMIVRLDETTTLKCIGIHNRQSQLDTYANIRLISDNETLVVLAKVGLQHQYIDIINIDANLSLNGINIKIIANREF